MNYRIALSAITGLLFVSGLSSAQTVLLERPFSLNNKSVIIQILSSKNDSSVLFCTNQSKDTSSIKKKNGEAAIFAFINGAVQQQLQKIYGDANAGNIIQVFADAYSKLAIEKIFQQQTIKVQEVTIGKYILAKYVQGKNREYYCTPADLLGQPVLIVSKQEGKYLFHDIMKTHPVLNNFSDLMGFITKDTNITSPVFVYAKDTLTLNEGADAIKIAINAQQAEAWFGKDVVAAGEPISSLAAKPSTDKQAPESTPQQKNGETTLLSPQKITCSDKLEFELAALSTQRGTVDSFQVEMNTANNKKRLTLAAETGEIGFRREVKTQLIQDSCTTAIDSTLTIFYVKLTEKLATRKKELEESAKKAEGKKFTDSINQMVADRLALLGAEKEYAALLECRKSIPLYTEKEKKCCHGSQSQRKITAAARKTLEIDSVVMRVSNNTVYQLDIVGKVDKHPVQTLSNNGYGLSLRNLIDGGQQLYFTLDGQEYHFCYRDVFFARPTKDGVISYEIRDAVYHFTPDTPRLKTQHIDQKRLLDYVSASAFIDLLAFNAENTNKNLMTELYFNYHINPLNIHRGFGMFKNGYLPVSFGVNLFKEGQGMETFRRKEIIAIDSSVSPHDTSMANRYYFKNLELMRNAFLNIRPMVNIFTYDAKKLRTLFELNFGYLLLGSNARLTDPAKGVDSNFTRAIYSYSWASEARIRLNPRPRYGFDLHVMYAFGLRPLSTDFQSVTGDYRINDLGKAKQLGENKNDFILGELNFFFNPQKSRSDTDRGGLYFKLNWYKSMYYRDGHFMFLVGYSTDIKNFFR